MPILSSPFHHEGASNDDDEASFEESGAFRIASASGEQWGEANLSRNTNLDELQEVDDDTPLSPPPSHEPPVIHIPAAPRTPSRTHAPVVIPSLMPMAVTRPMMNAVSHARLSVDAASQEALRRQAFLAAKLNGRPVQPPPDEARPAVAHAPPPPPPPPPPPQEGGPTRYGTVKMEAVRAAIVPEAPPPPSSGHMPPPSSSGRMFDAVDFAADAPNIDLELTTLPSGQMRAATDAMTSGHHLGDARLSGPVSNIVRFGGEAPAPPPPSSSTAALLAVRTPSRDAMLAVRTPSREMLAVRTPSREMHAVQQPGSPAAATIARGPASTSLRDPRRTGVFAFAGYGPAPDRLLDTPTYALRVLSRKRVLRQELEIARAHRRAEDVELYMEALRTADAAAYNKGIAVLAVIFGLAAAGAVTAILYMLA